MTAGPVPTLRVERRLLRAGAQLLACGDEVGRGALCGPVTVGVVVVTDRTRTAPQGVRDSKLLSAAARERLVPAIRRWAAAWAVGHASPAEIDRFGIIGGLRLAGRRALADLPVTPDLVLLDGNHDYLSEPAQSMLFPDETADVAIADLLPPVPPVVTQIKADLRCAGVAAASILAKTARDAIMADLARDQPEYGWARNKGYAAADHIAALSRLGPSPHHRVSWRLPGVVAGSMGHGPVPTDGPEAPKESSVE